MSGAVRKSKMSEPWALKKKAILEHELQKGTSFPKESISVIEAVTSK